MLWSSKEGVVPPPPWGWQGKKSPSSPSIQVISNCRAQLPNSALASVLVPPAKYPTEMASIAWLSVLVVASADMTFSFRGLDISLPQAKFAPAHRWLLEPRRAVESRSGVPTEVLEASNRETVRQVLELVDERSDRWAPVVEAGRTRVWQLKRGGHACILAKGVIDAEPRRVYELFAEAKRAKDFNEYCEQCVDIDRLSHDTKISWSVTKSFASGFFKPRDFVTLCHYADLKDGSRCIVNRATTHRAKPIHAKYQRAEVVLAANIVKPHGRGRTHLTLLTEINPGGAIDNRLGATIANQIVKRSPLAFFDAVETAANKVRPSSSSSA